jgi:DNA-binding MarR family transcriptional regulator
MFRQFADISSSMGVELSDVMIGLTRLRRENDLLLAAIARDRGLNTPDFRALAFLNAWAGATPRDLADYLAHSMSTTTATIDRLVAAGYVERTPNPEDGRSVRLEVTVPGASAVAEAIEIYNAAFEVSIPEDRRAEVAAAFAQIADAFAAVTAARKESDRAAS